MYYLAFYGKDLAISAVRKLSQHYRGMMTWKNISIQCSCLLVKQRQVLPGHGKKSETPLSFLLHLHEENNVLSFKRKIEQFRVQVCNACLLRKDARLNLNLAKGWLSRATSQHLAWSPQSISSLLVRTQLFRQTSHKATRLSCLYELAFPLPTDRLSAFESHLSLLNLTVLQHTGPIFRVPTTRFMNLQASS